MEIKVSVITPMYNSARYLHTCINSFLNQTLDGCELVLVDDASPDDSYEIAKEFECLYPNSIVALHYDENRRAGGARNYGLKNARGKYVCFLDADDWIDSTMLEKCYKLATSEECEIVDCDYYECIDEKDAYPKYIQSMKPETTGKQTKEKIMENIVSGGRCFSKIYLRSMLIDNNMYYPENLRYEDNGICPLLNCKSTRIGKIEEALYYYRIGNSSSQMGTVLSMDALNDRFKVAEYLLKKSDELGLLEMYFQAIEYRFVELYYASNLQIIARGDIDFDNKRLKEIKETVFKLFPNYKKNSYIAKYFPLRYKLCCYTYDMNPMLFNIYKRSFIVAYNLYSKICTK